MVVDGIVNSNYIIQSSDPNSGAVLRIPQDRAYYASEAYCRSSIDSSVGLCHNQQNGVSMILVNEHVNDTVVLMEYEEWYLEPHAYLLRLVR